MANPCVSQGGLDLAEVGVINVDLAAPGVAAVGELAGHLDLLVVEEMRVVEEQARLGVPDAVADAVRRAPGPEQVRLVEGRDP